MKKLFVAIVLCVFLISFASATLSFSNYAEFKDEGSKYGTLDVWNGNWVLPDEKVATYTLIDNTDLCIINCHAIGTGTNYVSGTMFEGVKFEDLEEQLTSIESYQFFISITAEEYIEIIEDYEENCIVEANGTSCRNIQIGTHEERRIRDVWNEYNGEEVLGDYKWKLTGKKAQGQSVDWIAKSNDVELEEWATWDAAFDVGLTHYWGFNEGSGSTSEDSGGLEFGTQYDMGLFMDTNFSTGKSGSGLYFDGTLDNASIIQTASVGLPGGTTDWTVSIWVNPSASLTGYIIVYPDESWRMVSETGGRNRYFGWGGDTASQTVMHDQDNTHWYHAVMMHQSGRLLMYINGTLRANVTGGGNQAVSYFTLGDKAGGGTDFGGTLDELAIWNRSMEGSEIADLYNNDLGTFFEATPPPAEMTVTVTLDSPEDYYNTSSTSVIFNSHADIVNGNVTNATSWFNDTGLFNYTALTYLTNYSNLSRSNFVDGEYLWNVYYCAENATGTLCDYAGANRTITIDITPPSVSIELPLVLVPYHSSGDNLTLNWTSLDPHLDSCWYNYNGTDTPLTCSENTSSFNVTNYLNRTITFYANDTLGNENNSIRNWNYSVFENSRTFNSVGYETDNENFTINVTFGSTFSSVTGNLVYNKTSYVASRIGNIFSRTLILPIITADTQMNFTWSFYNTSTTINTSISTQNISSLTFQLCNVTLNNTYVNFTLKDEEDTSIILNGSFSALFDYWIGDGTVKESYSYSDTTDVLVNFDFCADPPYKTFNTDMSADYSAPTYSPRTYSLSEAILTNTTRNIDLLLLNESNSVKFFFTVLQGLAPVQEAFVTISKKDTSTGEYNTIGIRETDGSGKFIEYLELDKEYQFTIIKQGSLLGVLYKTSICTAAPCEIQLEIEEAFVDFWEGYYDIYAQSVAYNLTFNSTINTIDFVFTDLTGLAQYFRLNVHRIDYNQTGATICNDFVYTTAGTITCNLSGYNGQFRADAYISRSPEVLIDTIFATIREIAGAIKEVVGGEGLLFTLFLVITVGLIGFWNPAVGLILIVVTLFFSTTIGFISISLTTITLIIMLAIFLIVKMGKGT